jgi:hypothetical protein
VRKEERQVTAVVNAGAQVRLLAFQPVFELGEFCVHGSLLFREAIIKKTRRGRRPTPS